MSMKQGWRCPECRKEGEIDTALGADLEPAILKAHAEASPECANRWLYATMWVQWGKAA